MSLSHTPSSMPIHAQPTARARKRVYRNTPHGRLMLLTIFAVALPARFLFDAPPPRLAEFSWWAYLLIMPFAITVALYATIAIHEVGHFIIGRLAGFRAVFITIGPLQWTRSAIGWHLHFSGYGGISIQGRVMTMPTPELLANPPRLQQRLQWVHAGGPIANLIFALALYAILYSVPAGTFDQIQRSVLVAFTLLNTLFFTWTALPITVNNAPSDGGCIWQLRHDSPEIKRELAILGIASESQRAIRPCDWSPAFLRRVLLPQDDTVELILGNLLAFQTAMDEGETEVARLRLDTCLDILRSYPADSRPVQVLWAAARYEALMGSAATAQEWWQLSRRKLPPQTIEIAIQRLHTRAVLAKASGALELASDLAREALAHIPYTYQLGSFIPVQEQLEQLVTHPSNKQIPIISRQWWPILWSLLITYGVMIIFSVLIIVATSR